MRAAVFGLAVMVVAASGCTSVKTTVLDRREGGHLTKNPDLPLKGVPVMLRVPTHVDVTIEQVDYWYPDGKSFVQVGAELPSRHVKAEIKHTEKMFLVDPKRVASGTGIYGFSFDPDNGNAGRGYLKGVSYEAVDTTLKESAALISNIAKVVGSPTSAAEELASDSKVIATSRTIAFRKFDINSCSIEHDIREFVNDYLNDCHPDCCTDPQYPGSVCQ